jgi:phosphoglycerate dehydrogenase-like enzyme
VDREFRIGITPDFDRDAKGLIDPVLTEWLDGLPGVTHGRLADVGPIATPAQLRDVDGVINLALKFGPESFTGQDRLTVIARWGVGYEMIDVDACTANDVALCITPEGVRRPMAEAEMAMVLALSKRLTAKDRALRGGVWRGDGVGLGVGIHNRVVGTIGLGNIGSEFVRLVRPFGPRRILVSDPYAAPGVAEALGAELVSLEAVMRESDFVVVNCLLNKQTYHLLGARELGWMKPTAYLVNCARGGIVDPGALYETLTARRIAGAALDVFEPEPPDPANPLLRLDNVIVTPHAIAWTEEIVRDNAIADCEACLAVSRGEVPKHIVNRAVVDRPGFQTKLARYRRQNKH